MPLRNVTVIALTGLLALGACGESTEEAYQRGYDDGIDQICFEIGRWNSNVYEALRSDRIC